MASHSTVSSLSRRDSTVTASYTTHRLSFSFPSEDPCPVDPELRRVRSRGGREYSMKCLKPRSNATAAGPATTPFRGGSDDSGGKPAANMSKLSSTRLADRHTLWESAKLSSELLKWKSES